MEKQFLIAVCGPTASGKTSLAVRLAQELDGEVVSADSMQIYKYLNIAVAKPTEEETQGIPHHLIDFLDPKEGFSVADYVRLAKEKIADIAAHGKQPIVCGGTGLYISSLIDNISFDEDGGQDMEYREELGRLAAEKGNEYVLDMLREIDPETAARLHPNNLKRIIRALEVYKLSGKTMSEAQRDSRKEPSPYQPCMLMIDYDRETLYGRIDRRVDVMLEQGLIDEAREFFGHTDYSTAAQAIGYKELKPYISGEEPLEVCVERLKRETRRYAKRQLTWFYRDERIFRILADMNTDNEEIFRKAKNYIKTCRNSG
ncbi:MAG: tRNA (adenosine(37)-N6)-dimethylallyltransferase MiaA [Eubacterium sp.]|nr:tRNA (adenosine(37)-N6)-dimethylallyltransferase MiaA [Eubacterium sp.]